MTDQSEPPRGDKGEEESKPERMEGELPQKFVPFEKFDITPSIRPRSGPPEVLSGRLSDDERQPASAVIGSPGSPRVVDNRSKDEILNSLRRSLGGEEYQAQVERFGEENLFKMVAALGEKAVLDALEKLAIYQEKSPPPQATPSRSAPAPLRFNKVRTRESGRRVNRFVVWLALIYGAVIGALYPDGALVSEIYNSLLPVVIVVVLLVSAVLFFRTGAFDVNLVFTVSVAVTIGVALILGVIANFGKLGVRPLAAAGLAFAGCFIVGMLFGRPIFRWIERKQLEERVWIYQLIAGLLAIGMLTAGWFGIVALIPFSLPVP